MTSVNLGTRVRIIGDGDGASGVIGVVTKIYKSGRLRVDLPDGGIRNLAPDSVEVVKAAVEG